MNQQNIPGQSSRMIGERTRNKRKKVAFAALGIAFICLLMIGHAATAWILLIPIILVLKITDKYLQSNTKKCRTGERKAERGAKAEETVDGLLTSMEGDFAVFHDVDTGYGDIDHIILSRHHGLILLETKAGFARNPIFLNRKCTQMKMKDS